MIRFFRKYIKVFILLFLPVYLLLLANSMLNMHVHILSNGMVVRHAHPFAHHSDPSGESHHHTGKEYIFYHGFFLNYYDTAESVAICQQFSYRPLFAGKPVSDSYSFAYSVVNPLRGPPAGC